MSRFVLTAQLQLQAPNNVRQVVNQIQGQLAGVNVPINVQNAASATRQINQIRAATNDATTAAERMGTAFGVSLKRFASFSIATRAVGLFTNGLAGAIRDAIAFERQLIKVAQVSNQSISSLKGLTSTITELATSLGVESKSLLEVSTILKQAGLSANDTSIALRTLAKAALAPNFDSITETTEGAIAILAQFGLGVQALEGQLSSIDAVAGAFAVEASDLIDVIRRTGGVFKSSGGDLNELIALFTSVRATTRESAESIGTGLRTIFTRIQRPKTIEYLKQFGIELVDLEGKFVGPFEAVKRLSAALNGLGEGDLTFIRIAEELGGFRQIGKVLPLLQQFALAQNALNVAQKAGDGLTQNAITAQQALAIRITKVKEEFLAFVRGVTESRGFQLFVNTALNLASAFIKIGEALTPVIPLLTAMMAINISRGIGSFLTSIPRGLSSTRFSGGGRVLGFEKGGMVPGVGNKDTVPAMLTPGEVVMNRSAVQKYGAGNLVRMNKYGYGGKVSDLASIYPTISKAENYQDYKNKNIKDNSKFIQVVPSIEERISFREKYKGKAYEKFENFVADKYNLGNPVAGFQFLDYPNKRAEAKFLPFGSTYKDGDGRGNNKKTAAAKNFLFENSLLNLPGNRLNISAKTFGTSAIASKPITVYWGDPSDFFKSISRTSLAKERFPSGAYSIGGLVQRFEEGGIAQRRVGIIDSDVLRDKKNAARVAEGMKLLDAKSEADYAIKLSKLAGEARQSGSLSKFSVMAGAAANRKSSVATGRGANDNATLRKTTRKQILHPDDLKDVDQVMSLTTTLKESKLDYMGMADRIYVKDSSTEDEQKLVKLFERQRNLQKDPTLYGRETGTTEGLNPDYGLQTASLISQFGTTEDRTNKGKVMTLGEKTDQSGAPRFQIRRKRLEELPELVSAKGQFPGAASPLTRGHAETAVGTLLAKVREKYPDATHKDLLFALAPDLSLSGGSQGREHGSRYGEYPASFRRDLIKLALPEMMISSADSPSQTGINSRIAEIEKGATGRRRFAVMEKDAPVVISKAENENPEGVMERYRSAGLTPYNIARSADTEGDSISGTATRQAVIDKDYAKLDLAVLPQVGSAIKANQPQLRNRRMMVPLVQQALDIFTQANASKINEQVGEILQNASGGPFTRMTPKFKEAHPNLVKQIQQLRKNRDIFERESFLDPAHELIRTISDRYPDIYGLDVARKEPVDVSVTEDMIKQHIVDSSKLSSYFKPGLSFNGDGIQLSPTLQKVKDAVEKEVKSEVAVEPTVDKEIVAPSSRSDIFKVLSRDEAAVASGVDKIKTYNIMGLRRELTAEEQRVKDAVKDAYVQKVKNKSRAAKATTTKLRGKGLEFGAAGLFGKAFAAKNIKIESDKLSSSRMVRVMSGVMDQATATRLSTTMSKGVSDIVSQGTNIVKSGSKQTALATSPIQNLNTNTNATIQGGLIEQIIQQLGGPGAVKGKGFDFPDGLQGAAKYFNIDPNIPTDVKRTLSGPLTIKDNIVTYLKNVMGYNDGGIVRKFAKAGKVDFGTGETRFPKKISNLYEREMRDKVLKAKSIELFGGGMFDIPKDERINIDESKASEEFSQPFDRQKFMDSFKSNIMKNSLYRNLSDFAKFIGLPSQDLSKILPQSIDFGGERMRMGTLGAFFNDPFGARGYDNLDLSSYGFSTADEQDLYGYQKLLQEKEKEANKIIKTPIETFDDGSFRYDEAAFKKAYDEKSAMQLQISKVMDKQANARKAAMEARKQIVESTGRGFIGIGGSLGGRIPGKNDTLYHELTHQLFKSLKLKQADSFTKYKDRVEQLFNSDNDALSDAFDALPGSSYSSADVVYGRYYKNAYLSQALSNNRSESIKAGGRDINPELSKDGYIALNKSEATKKAREYKPINPQINKLLLAGGIKEESINKAEDIGKEEFLTTLIQKAPELDANMQGILDSTLNELLRNTGIQRQQYAVGGVATKEELQNKEKNYGKIGLRSDGSTINATYFKNDKREGYVSAYKMRDYLYYVGLSKATQGYGPRLYDAVMEEATAKGAMLTSDRSSISGAAKKVWEYYFKNRGDVKKTPLKPDDWVRNQAEIDPKLYGKPETWPPPTDPAWILQSGYSKSPSLINDKNSVIRMGDSANSGAMALQYFSRANGGRLGFETGGTVPALVSNGEAYVPPAMAKKIGYGRLNRMNQADRNGMGRFSEGGISVFNGPGTGTSDSIPANLPVGSFIIRAKATKALGLNNGGRVQKFADGGTPIQQRVSALYDQRQALKERSKTATGTESTQIAKQMQDIDKEMEKLEVAYKKLTDIIEQSTKRESTAQKKLDKANQNLIAKLQNQDFGGKRFSELDASAQEAAINSARKGKFKDSSGNDIFANENRIINTRSKILDESRLDRDLAQQTLSTRFGGTAPTFDMEARRRGDTPFPYPTPTPSSGGITVSGGTPPSAGTPPSGKDESGESRNGFNKLTNVLSIATASLNGLVQTVGGTDNAFANGVSNILGNITAVSSSFSVLEELTGQQIKSVGDFLNLSKNTGKSLVGIDDTGKAKDDSLAKLFEDKLGAKFGAVATNLVSGIGNMVGAFAQGSAAFQLVVGSFLAFDTTQKELDAAIKAGNTELALTLSDQNSTMKDISTYGAMLTGSLFSAAQAVSSTLPLLSMIGPKVGSILATLAGPAIMTGLGAIGAAFSAVTAVIVPFIVPVLAITAALAALYAGYLYINDQLGEFGSVFGSFSSSILSFADTLRDVASYIASWFGFTVNDSETNKEDQRTKITLESSTNDLKKISESAQKEQNLTLNQLSKGQISGQDAFKPFAQEALQVTKVQQAAKSRIAFLERGGVTATEQVEIDATKKQANQATDEFEKKTQPIIRNVVNNAVASGVTDPKKIFEKLPKELKDVISSDPEKMKEFMQGLSNAAKEGEELQKRLKALSLGFDSVLVSVKAADAANKNFANSLTVGNNPIDSAMATIDAALAGAANKLKVGELDSAINTVAGVLQGLGASEAEVKKYKDGISAISKVQEDFPKTFETLKKNFQEQNISPEFKDVVEGMKDLISNDASIPEDARKMITDSLNNSNLSEEQQKEAVLAFNNGNFTKLREILGLDVLGGKFNELAVKSVAPVGEALKNLNNVINQRIESEKNLVSAQREAIDLSLEGMQIQSKYGGPAVTPEIRRQAALESANVGRRRLGLEDIRGSNPNALRAGLNQTRLKFAELEQRRFAQEQSGVGAVGPRGVEDEATRSGLKDAQKDQVKLIRDLISAEEEQLKITKEKNKLEKDSLESLLAGDIDKFFEQQAAVGATAAIASGNRAAIGQFGGQALGGAYQNLQRQKEAGVTELFGRRINGAGGLLENSAMASLGARGIQNPRMAQILAGTTQEEEASNRRLREYGGLLGEAGAAGAEMAAMEVARAEMNVERATINVKNAGGGDLLNNQPQGKSRGGIVYASKGQLINFVPKGTDTVPAMLTPGEFVVNRGAVNRGDNLSFLRAINNGQYTANAQRLNSNTSSIPNILKQLTSSPQSLQTQDTQRKVVQNERNISNVNFDVQKLSKELGKFMSGFDGFMENFSEQVGKLGNTEVSHKLGDVNLNINGGQFLQSMADGLKQQLMEDLGQKLQGIKVNNVGNIKFGRTSVL